MGTDFDLGPTGAFLDLCMQPTADGKGNPPITLETLFKNWNNGLKNLRPHIKNPDVAPTQSKYKTAFKPADLPSIPSIDIPPGIPDWMRTTFGWATMAKPPGNQRASYRVTVP
jgi:hypothetical protein